MADQLTHNRTITDRLTRPPSLQRLLDYTGGGRAADGGQTCTSNRLHGKSEAEAGAELECEIVRYKHFKLEQTEYLQIINVTGAKS